MATKISRLPREEYRARGYRTAATPLFLLKIKKNVTEKARIGVVIGKSVHKTAVKRNFWKRQAKSALTAFAKDGFDFLLIFSPAAASATRKEFRDAVARVMAKAPLKA
jgi:ribonuclease P protein component